MPLAIDLQNLRLQRGHTTLLDDVTLRVPRGTAAALLGHNGCGKTTLARILLGQLYPTAGRATVLGQTLGRTDIRQLRRRIGFVSPTADQGPENFHVTGAVVDANLSATDAVCTGYFATVGLYDLPTDPQRHHARQLLTRVGLGHRCDHTFGLLSTGEQRRALLARALVYRPELLILDEPTAGLDPPGREAMLATLESLLAEPDPPAMLLITHHVEELSPSFSQVVVMRQGKVLADGPPADVLTSALLSEAFGLAVRVHRRHGRHWLEIPPIAGKAGGWPSPGFEAR